MDSQNRFKTPPYRATIDFLMEIIERADNYQITPNVLAIVKELLSELGSATFSGKGKCLIFRVERRFNRSLCYRSIILSRNGLFLQSGQSEPDYDSEHLTIYSDEQVTNGFDEVDYYNFFVEFEDLLGYDERIIIAKEEFEEEEEFDVFEAAESYTNKEILTLLQTVIADFQQIGLNGSDLVVISKLLMLLENPSHYRYHGYLCVTFTTIDLNKDEYFYEISYSRDALSLISGGYVKGEYGGDSFSKVVYPFEDEDEAMDAVQLIDVFVSSIQEKLSIPDKLEVETTDSGDEIGTKV